MENNLEKIKTAFTSKQNINKLTKEQLIYRDGFLTKFQQKFDFSISDFDDLDIKQENDIIIVSSFNKNDLKFIFIDNMSNDSNIIIKYDENIEKLVRKNKGISFIILNNKDNQDYTIINSKDYFDLFFDKVASDKILISNFKDKNMIKRLKNVLFS